MSWRVSAVAVSINLHRFHVMECCLTVILLCIGHFQISIGYQGTTTLVSATSSEGFLTAIVSLPSDMSDRFHKAVVVSHCYVCTCSDMSKPINVLTGIDYWLDNLMCNVPELAMCYHDNGIVQVSCIFI